MSREIVVNGRFLARRVTGVERHGREILSRLRDRVRVEETRLPGAAGHVWEQVVLPAKLNSKSTLWSPANTGPVWIRNQALTIHDLGPLDHPEWFNTRYAAWHRLILPILAKRVRTIFTPSEYVRRRVMKRLGVERIVVVPNGVDGSVFHPQARQRTYEFHGKYILFVGSIQPRKNLTGLVNAWRELKHDFPNTSLIIAGEAGRVFRPVPLATDERIRLLNDVSDDDLPGLYAAAEMLVLPSFDEGFGLPALEAMACGTPVVVSDGGALPETVADAGLVFSIAKRGSLIQEMKKCLGDESLRAALIEKGLARAKTFSWQTSAELIWNTLNEF